MNANFDLQIPTHVYFGDEQLEKIGDVLKSYGEKVLMLYDSGWIKNTDWYQTIIQKIDEAGLTLFELGGIEPNPRSYSVNAAADICKKEGIDVLLPIGGGPVVDTAKLASVAAFHDGDCWDFITGEAKMEKFLPIVVVSTIAGTGTDMDAYGIVSNAQTHDKLPFFNPGLFPSATFLDPTITMSVSPFQTACGAIDALSHYLEYNLNEDSAALYYEFGVNVLGIDPELSQMEVARKMIAELRHLFFDVCGLKQRLTDYVEMDDSKLDEMAEVACRGGVVHGFVDMSHDDAKNILKLSM